MLKHVECLVRGNLDLTAEMGVKQDNQFFEYCEKQKFLNRPGSNALLVQGRQITEVINTIHKARVGNRRQN